MDQYLVFRGVGRGDLDRALNRDIHDWIEAWNNNPKPCLCTKTTDQILETIKRYCTRINDSRH